METLHFYGCMSLGAQHGHKEVVLEEARLVHCILLTTEAGAGTAGAGRRWTACPGAGS